MKIGIVGWGVEGQSAYNFFGPEHEYLIVSEHSRDDFPAQTDNIHIQYSVKEKPEKPTGVVEDLSYLEGLNSCDKIIYTPVSVFNLKKQYGSNPAFWTKAITVQHLFFQTVRSKNIIGVTGTKGKGTTSTLIYKMLEADGKKIYLGGNIGNSMLDFVRDVEPDDWVVLELSNFQLKDFPYSPHVAVCLMIVPEHLDWHPNLEDYIKAKSHIFRHQSPNDIAIYFAANEYSARLAQYSPGKKIPYFRKPGAFVREDGAVVIGEQEVEIIKTDDIKLLGEHNLQNICAAVTAFWQVGRNVEAINKVLTAFTGLEHRLEFVSVVDGVKYFDDSFGTTPETAIVAMKAFQEPKVLILGGSEKGSDFAELADEVLKNNVKHVVAIGKTGTKITELLKQRGFTAISEGGDTMEEIVAAARKSSQPGDVVLLSTGCASFGLFKDYKDRGNQFKQVVGALGTS